MTGRTGKTGRGSRGGRGAASAASASGEPAAKKQRGSPAKVADAALEAAAAPLETAVEKLAFNAGYYATIDNHIKQIDEDLVLGDVRSAPPLAISRELEAGFQEPWF